jgi:hypothetical protein
LYWAARRAFEEGQPESVLDQLADAAISAGLDDLDIQRTFDSARRAHGGGDV